MTVSTGFAAYPFLPHAPEALSWEQTLELADHALRLCKRRQRNSYTGLRATPDAAPAAVLEFLASHGAMPAPGATDILTPDNSADNPPENTPDKTPGKGEERPDHVASAN